MSNVSYISLFSGIGGLEHPQHRPVLMCEIDPACRWVLNRRYPGVSVVDDVRRLGDVPSAEIVAGGWPCQDLSSAGTLSGIRGARSGLFFEMLRVAHRAGAHTLIGENVPNLLTINRGADFRLVIDALEQAGYRFISWRVLNARAFGLPQERRRLFVVASRKREHAAALHAELPALRSSSRPQAAAGFYWTGGKRSICFSIGYVPALKIGATDNNGRAPVAVLRNGSVRKLSASEFLRLQGFEDFGSHELVPSTLLRMAGNAVPKPMGHFVMEAVTACREMSGITSGFGIIGNSGLVDHGLAWTVDHRVSPAAANLDEFLTDDGELLSPQASAGLIVRSVRSGHQMPRELFDVLWSTARIRTGRLRPSRANSFDALDTMRGAIAEYSARLPALAEYCDPLVDGDQLAEREEEAA